MPSILIIGGGLAGLFAALKLAPLPCTLLSPTALGEGAASAWAQGGIAAAIGEGDSVESHVQDTLAAGAGLCDAAMVRLMAAEAADRILDLLEFGVPFDRDLAGRLVQSREAAHSVHRIVRVKGDQAGKAIMAALGAAAQAAPSIRILEGVEAIDLLLEAGVVRGARARLPAADGTFTLAELRADATVLATGGIGQLYAVTTNPKESRGDGLAMAARAGASIANAEFVQFHPTAIDFGKDPAPLATEALRGEGATLVDLSGQRFMLGRHRDAELAPRDIVARGVFEELMAGRRPALDATKAVGAQFPEKFPVVYAACRAAGLDPRRVPIPVTPAEHYHMGGIRTDADARSSLPGLFAIGEVACTGVHGANRLASNSLLEAVVFAARAAKALRAAGPGAAVDIVPLGAEPQHPPDERAEIARLRALMSRHFGVEREPAGMAGAIAELQRLAAGARSRPLRNMTLAAMLVATSAFLRRESRGGHFRADFPQAAAGGRASIALAPAALASFQAEV